MECVVEMIGVFRKATHQHPGEMELEVRLGSCTEHFCPGVTKEVFVQLERDMLADPRLSTHDKAWTEIMDYHYLGSDGVPVRTRVIVDSEQMSMSKEHATKRLLCKNMVQRSDGCDDVARLTLAHECPVVDPPGSCVPTHIRLKQRRTFSDVRDDGVVWRYELSRTWSANTRSAVEHKQHVSEPIYEVECELVDEHGIYLATRSDVEVAQSLMLKLSSLLGRDVHTDARVKREVTETQVGTALSNRRSKRRKRL